MAFAQLEAEGLGHDRSETDAGESGEATGEFGVVQLRRAESEFGQAGEILIGGVQDIRGR